MPGVERRGSSGRVSARLDAAVWTFLPPVSCGDYVEDVWLDGKSQELLDKLESRLLDQQLINATSPA